MAGGPPALPGESGEVVIRCDAVMRELARFQLSSFDDLLARLVDYSHHPKSGGLARGFVVVSNPPHVAGFFFLLGHST